MNIDLEAARSMVSGARAAGRAHGWKPLAIVVLDAGGQLVCAEREDGASIGRIDIARAKAEGALALGMGSRALMARAEQQPYFITAAASAMTLRLVPVPGGVLVKDDQGVVVGAVGVSGEVSDNDEAAAVAGIEAAGFAAETG